jgi:hypothetical protein
MDNLNTPTVKNMTDADRRQLSEQMRHAPIFMGIFFCFSGYVVWTIFERHLIAAYAAVCASSLFCILAYRTVLNRFRSIADGKKICFESAVITNKDAEFIQRRAADDEVTSNFEYVVYLGAERIDIGAKNHARFNIGDVVDVEITQLDRILLKICAARQVNA